MGHKKCEQINCQRDCHAYKCQNEHNQHQIPYEFATLLGHSIQENPFLKTKIIK